MKYTPKMILDLQTVTLVTFKAVTIGIYIIYIINLYIVDKRKYA